MIFAEVQGKLCEEAARSEDVLTSCAFGLLRYLPFESGLGAALKRARPVALAGESVSVHRDPNWLRLDDVTGFDIEFWPRFRDFGSPDVHVRLLNDQRRVAGLGVIEVKYFSSKSGCVGDEDSEEIAEDAPDPDQLVKYWKGLCLHRGDVPVERLFIVYLTSHVVPPVDELRASLIRNRNMRLTWLSWTDIFAAVEESSELPARDLIRLLDFKGLRPFRGFRAMPQDFPSRGFWEGR